MALAPAWPAARWPIRFGSASPTALSWPVTVGCALVAACLAIFAGTGASPWPVAPIALVAALRETSVLFAGLFGATLLREPMLPLRLLAAVLVLAGALLLRFR